MPSLIPPTSWEVAFPSSRPTIEESCPAHHPVDLDLERHPIGSFARLAIALGIGGDRGLDALAFGDEANRTLEGEPPSSVDLTDGGSAAPLGIASLLRTGERDDAHHVRVVVVAEPDGHDVG